MNDDETKLLSEPAGLLLRDTANRIGRWNLLVNDGAPTNFAGTEIALPEHGRRVRVDLQIKIRTAPPHETRNAFGSTVFAVTRQAAIDSLTRREYAERLRNYELEQRLSDVFEGTWIVWEACPFNEEYCAWGQATGRVTT